MRHSDTLKIPVVCFQQFTGAPRKHGLAVGEGEKSGDAIALRFGYLNGPRQEQRIVVIDGGFSETGQRLVDHIKNVYQTSRVDLVVSTHPDNDHSGGLAVVLEQLRVDTLWMHQPWEHTDDIAKLFKDGRVTDESVRENLRKSLDDARSLETIARRKSIPIVEPFTGTTDASGSVFVVGPTRSYYESLLPGFRGTPDPKYSFADVFLRKAAAVSEAIKTLFENWGFETLSDDGQTPAANNSSSIILVHPEVDRYLLFTGDAGIPALLQVADVFDAIGLDRKQLAFVQIPHHGSRRNVGPSLLNRLLNPIQPEHTVLRMACVSAAKEGAPKHPAKKVTNAFKRRGCDVLTTSDGLPKCVFYGTRSRPGRGRQRPCRSTTLLRSLLHEA